MTDALTRFRASQRRFRNTLIFVAAAEALLGTAREAMRKAKAWGEIAKDERLHEQLPSGQVRDAVEKARTHRDGAAKAVRLAWSHILYPFKNDATEAGKAFELEQLTINSKDGAAIPTAVYEKISAKGDGILKETIGSDTFWLNLKPLWPEDRPHLGVTEVADWFASYVYLPKIRDRVVVEGAIRTSVAKLDPAFGYADRFDTVAGKYVGLAWAKSPPDIMPDTALIVRAEAVLEQLRLTEAAKTAAGPHPYPGPSGGPSPGEPSRPETPPAPRKPHRFYGSVEIDMVRPIKSFEQVLNAVVMELQGTAGAKVKLTLEIEAEAPNGFGEADIGVVRDNARQLKFKPESTGFD